MKSKCMKGNSGDKFAAESDDDLVYIRIIQIRIEAGIRGAVNLQNILFLPGLVLEIVIGICPIIRMSPRLRLILHTII